MFDRNTLAASTALLVATAPFAALAAEDGVAYVDGVVTTESPLIDEAAQLEPEDADAIVAAEVSNDPVVIQDGIVVSAVQPIDMDLRAIPNTDFAFRNAAGQIVIMVPEGRDVAVVN